MFKRLLWPGHFNSIVSELLGHEPPLLQSPVRLDACGVGLRLKLTPWEAAWIYVFVLKTATGALSLEEEDRLEVWMVGQRTAGNFRNLSEAYFQQAAAAFGMAVGAHAPTIEQGAT